MWTKLGVCAVAALAAYLIAVAVYRARVTADRGVTLKILGYELAVCAVMLMAMAAPPVILRVTARVLCLPLAALLFPVLRHMGDRPITPPDCAVVLGMALENGRPNRDLIYRLDAAVQYYEAQPGVTLVVTGGNAGPGRASEAAVMRDYLTDHGVPEAQILSEDRAVDTPGNFENVARLMDPARPVAVITSGYHVCRAVGIARAAGFRNACGLGARCDGRFWIANVAWELICEVDGLLKGNTDLF